jgi:hypothetical protein
MFSLSGEAGRGRIPSVSLGSAPLQSNQCMYNSLAQFCGECYAGPESGFWTGQRRILNAVLPNVREAHQSPSRVVQRF